MKRSTKIILLVIASIVVLMGLVFGIYVSDFDKATQPAVEAMKSTNLVVVKDNDDHIVYQPIEDAVCGLIFYPGGRVEPTVYSRVFQSLAQQGIQTVVVKMPFNLAMFNINGADDVINNYSEIDTWYLGGHSLGGVFATEYLSKHVNDIEGMIYLASYPNADISDVDIRVLTLNGTLDTVLNREAYEAARSKMPVDTVYYDIEGGNHTQFGDYDLQKGDTEPTITAKEQQRQIVEQILQFVSED